MMNKNKVIKIGLCGATGRIGQEIIKLVSNSPDKYYLQATHSSIDSSGNLLELCKVADVIIDFSVPKLQPLLLRYAQMNSTPLVIGTTGISKLNFQLMQRVSKHIPICYSPNMSLMANIISFALKKISKLIDDNYDIEITEMHHRNKVDIPSGTSLMLGKVIADSKGWCFEDILCSDINSASNITNDILSNSTYSKSNTVKKSKMLHRTAADKIRFSSIRAGQLAGTHEVMFIGDDDMLSIKHNAMNRVVYAKGALVATELLLTHNRAGLYSYLDLFNTD